MTEHSSVALVSRRRAVLTAFVTALLLAVNRSTFGTVADAAITAVISLGLGYLILTAMDLLFDRLL